MSRIRNFYDSRFRSLARKFGKSPDEFAQKLFFRATELCEREIVDSQLGDPGARTFSKELALAITLADCRRATGETKNFPCKFLCDAGLGGLARWLRAAGYESIWRPELDDAGVIREAERLGATLITSDTMMMERGVLRDGLTPSICVPSSLTCEEHLAIVFREMALSVRESRCMACGGELRRVAKKLVAGRIPPRTGLWLDDYFLCNQCDQLFWRGTHWNTIAQKIRELNQDKLI